MLVTLVLSALSALPLAGSGEAVVRPVVGAPGDFPRVAHVRIEGSWFEIGRELARLGQERHGSEPLAARDRASVREQREYFAARYPAQLERMRGVADYFGAELEADALELDGVSYAAVHAGCTVVYYPPATTEDGRGVLSRNFDFTTGTWEGETPRAGKAPACAAPYVLELHPETGYASLAIVSFDLLGVVDGINSQGLTVALLADDELNAIGKARPTPGPRAGFDVLQVGRFLLDTCKDVPEAEAALRGARFYYTSIPCHYLVADAAGRSFVWENAVELDGGHVLRGDGGPQVTTNYLQHLHLDSVPADPDPQGLFGRQRALCARFAPQGKFSLDEVRANAASVSARAPASRGVAGRTLWHALYFPERRALEVDFYLGEGGGKGAEPRRSAVFAFELAER